LIDVDGSMIDGIKTNGSEMEKVDARKKRNQVVLHCYLS